MKTILFVIPNLKTGGSNSALSVLYSRFEKKYHIYVLPLSFSKNNSFAFETSLIECPKVLNDYHCNVKDAPFGLRRLGVFLFKLFKRICSQLGIPIEEKVYSHFANIILNRCMPDIVVAFEENAPTRFVSYFRSVFKIAWIHCNYDYYQAAKDEESIYCRFHRIVCVSEFTKNSFLKRYPSLLSITQSIHNLIDEKRILRLSDSTIDDSRYVHGTFSFISVGRLDPIKRFDVIPQIASSLKKGGSLFNWYILGPESVDGEKERLEREIIRNNVEDCVHYLGNKPNPYPYFRKSNVYVCVSISEACPMVFNEAKVLNIPIVTTDFGSASEFIIDGVNGYICDISSISERLKDLMLNPDLYHHLVDNLVLEERENNILVQRLSILFDEPCQQNE